MNSNQLLNNKLDLRSFEIQSHDLTGNRHDLIIKNPRVTYFDHIFLIHRQNHTCDQLIWSHSD